MTGTTTRPPDRPEKTRTDKAGLWVGVAVAWVLGIVVTRFTALLMWGLTSEYGIGRRYAHHSSGGFLRDTAMYMVPGMVLIGLAVWLTVHALDRDRWGLVAVPVALLPVFGAGVSAQLLSEADRQNRATGNCTDQMITVLNGLHLNSGAAEPPQGATSGGCYVAYTVEGSYWEAIPVVDSELTADGWTLQSIGHQEPSWDNYFSPAGVVMFLEAEGHGDLDGLAKTEDQTVFRLKLYQLSFEFN